MLETGIGIGALRRGGAAVARVTIASAGAGMVAGTARPGAGIEVSAQRAVVIALATAALVSGWAEPGVSVELLIEETQG